MDESRSSPSKQADAEIAARLQAGDETALASLMSAYIRPLRAIAAGITGRTDIAEEVLQDVLVKVWGQRDLLPEVRDLPAYLARMVRNQAFDTQKHERSQGRLGDRITRAGPNEPTIAHSAATKVLAAADVRRTVLNGLAQVPPRCREIFMLHWEVGLSAPEIADQLEITPATVHNQIYRAKKALAEYLRAHGF